MLNLLAKISPDLQKSSSKIGQILTINGKYLAFVINSNTIEVIDYSKRDNKSIKLDTHNKEIKCLKFAKNDNESSLLCSCSLDFVILWDVKKVFESQLKKGTIIAQDLKYDPTHCHFHPNKQVLAVCCRDMLTIYDIFTSNLIQELHFDYYISNLEFFYFNYNILFVTNQTNTLNIYDMNKLKIIKSIQNQTPHSFVSLNSSQNEPVLVTSSTDGCLNIYEYKNDELFYETSVSLEKLYQSKRQNSSKEEHLSEASMLCIGLELFTIGNKTINNQANSCQSLIICATTSCLFLIDLKTKNLLNMIDFKSIDLNTKYLSVSSLIPQVVDFCMLDNKQINAALLFLFQNEINVVKCVDLYPVVDAVQSKEAAIKPDEIIISVFPKIGLLSKSPLSENVLDKEKETTKSIPSVHELLKKTKTTKPPGIKDKPLTFSSRVRSSGYNQPVKREKFTPLINKNTRSLSLLNLNEKLAKDVKQKTASQKPAFKFELPKNLDKKINATDKSSAIILTKFSHDGQNLALVSSDNIIQVLPSSQLDKIVNVFNGHKETVRSVDISHDCKYLISASDDKTVKLWSMKKPYDLVFDLQSIKSKSESVVFKKGICSSNFFYLDKFVLIGTENKFYLCKYFIDDSKKNDVQRYLNGSVFKLIQKMELSFAQSITTISAINSFYSYVVLCAGTDKSIEVFDMNEGKSCLTIHEAHSRPFNQILQNGGEYNQNSYDLFLTSAVTDGLKLWDLRSAKCINKFDSHINRCLPIQASFSPDSNYISTGSEDRSASIYDLRMNNGIIEKYGVYTDTVSCTEFNPKRSQLICGTQDGKLYNYKI